MTETATKALPCLQLPCPKCGEQQANISLNLWSLDDQAAGNFTCHECDGEIALDEVRDLIARWSKVIAWIETIPSAE